LRASRRRVRPHPSGYGIAKDRGAATGERGHDIPLGENAFEAAGGIQNDDGANALVLHEPHRLLDLGGSGQAYQASIIANMGNQQGSTPRVSGKRSGACLICSEVFDPTTGRVTAASRITIVGQRRQFAS
jgi:hypothetical protein